VVVPSGGVEIEILVGRRAFRAAQQLFAGAPLSTPQSLDVGWHDSSVNPETGSFAVVQTGAGLDDLIGEIVQVRYYSRQVFAYVLEDADVPTPISITRRLFLALYRLTVVSLPVKVAPVG
jgi:hypothetical protein